MLHLIMNIRPHHTPRHGANTVFHGWAIGEPNKIVEGDLAEAISVAKEKMRDNYADPVEIQNEDRTRNEELTAQLLAGVRA